MGVLRKKTLPQIHPNQKDVHLLKNSAPFAVKEAYKTIRTNLLFSALNDVCKKIVVTSSLQGERKSTVAINLGISFANNQNKVLLIDCDLRLPTVAMKLGLQRAPGLTGILIGEESIERSIKHLKNGLDVLPSGNVPPNPAELLGSENFAELVKELETEYEYIIFDAPPVNVVSDACILSGISSGVVIVVGSGMATIDSTDECVRRLKMADAKILGFILSGVENEKLSGSYGRYGRYGNYGSYGSYANEYAKAAATAK